MKIVGKIKTLLAAGIICSAGLPALAQAAAGDNAPVTREEFNKMLTEMASLRQELAAMKQEKAAGAAGATPDVTQLRKDVDTLKKQREDDLADADDRVSAVEKMAKEARQETKDNLFGDEKILLTGDADFGFTSQKHSKSTFDAAVAPRILWKINDNFAFDAAFDVGVTRDDAGDNTTETNLVIASMTYTLNDYLVLGGGLFVAPFAAYHRDFDPSWINKMPDDPLVFSDNGLSPSSVLGLFVSGAYPICTTKINYAAYVSNGPELLTSSDNAGSLGWDNYTDLNNNKAVGGRIGFVPFPELEVGYSVLYGKSSPSGMEKVNALLQGLDLNFTKDFDSCGKVILRSEWVFSQVGDVTYDPDGGEDFGPLRFRNNRNGGYVQLSYRPTHAQVKELQKFEYVARWDYLKGPNDAPLGAGREDRMTLGVNYWIDPRMVIKAAYEFDHTSIGDSSPAFMLQFGIGF